MYEKDCPRVTDWYAHSQDRPSYQQAVADDFPEDVMTDLHTKGEPGWAIIQKHIADM